MLLIGGISGAAVLLILLAVGRCGHPGADVCTRGDAKLQIAPTCGATAAAGRSCCSRVRAWALAAGSASAGLDREEEALHMDSTILNMGVRVPMSDLAPASQQGCSMK